MNLSKTPGHEFDQTPGDSGGQRSLACCTPWGCKELPMTQQLNNKNNKALMFCYNANQMQRKNATWCDTEILRKTYKLHE